MEEDVKLKLFVATPMFGGNAHISYQRSINQLYTEFTARGHGLVLYQLANESLVPRARNQCVDAFLKSDCTHFLFIDADIGFQYNDVMSVLYYQMLDPEKYGVVTIPYPMKSFAWDKIAAAVKAGKSANDLAKYGAHFVLNTLPDTDTYSLNEPLEVLEAGTGFMAIQRDVFTSLAAKHPELRYYSDAQRTNASAYGTPMTAFFHCIIDESKRYLSEDYFFCKIARDAGYKVWTLPWLSVTHQGYIVYGGSILHNNEINESLN